VVHPGCRFTTVDADAAAAPDASTRGFVSFRGGTGTCGGRVWFIERRGGRWSRHLSPYTGQVLAVAADATGTYVLYRSFAHGRALRVGKRAAAGWYAGGRLLSSSPAVRSGAIVATGGRWWAMWSEDGPELVEGSQRLTDLYQAKIIGRELVKQRVTANGYLYSYDGYPSLLLRPGGATTLVWALEDFAGDVGSLGIGTAGSDGRWRLRDFEVAPHGHFVFHGSPDLALDGATTHVIWQREVVDSRGEAQSRLLTADDRGGWGPVHTFRTGGFDPRIAASGGRVVAGWTTGTRYGQSPSRVFVAERPSPGGIWTGVHISAASPDPQRLLALTSVAGRATALMASGTRVYARTRS
jgi:hypothetical protein